MKFLKITSCALLIAGLGYFVTQSYKRSDIKKRIEKFHDPKEKDSDNNALSKRIEGQLWLKENLAPIAQDLSHLKTYTADDTGNYTPPYIFASNNTIPIKETDKNDLITALRESKTEPKLYLWIAKKIDNFIDDLMRKFDATANVEFKNYFKTFDHSVPLTTDESSIIDKLKGADDFCTLFLNTLAAAKISPSNTVYTKAKQKIEETQTTLRSFAKDYFNLKLPS